MKNVTENIMSNSMQLKSILESQNLSYFAIIHPHSHQAEEEQYENWVKCGFSANMDYLKKHESLKLHPEKILPGCQSIILVGLNYFQKTKPLPKGHGRIARYAWGRDYHKVLGNKLKKITSELQELHPDAQFKFNTDATPLLERAYAKEAGLGYIGKNTMLISQPFGSWILIGEILTTLELPEQKINLNHGDCGSCRKCIDACPTGAIISPGVIDARKCISYLTIEHKGDIPKELRSKIGDRLFGCDACQECCPQNMRAKITTEPDFLDHRTGESISLSEILELETDEQFTEKFAGTPLMRAKREGLIRNACIVAANTNSQELLPTLKKLTKSKNSTIAKHARQAHITLSSS